MPLVRLQIVGTGVGPDRSSKTAAVMKLAQGDSVVLLREPLHPNEPSGLARAVFAAKTNEKLGYVKASVLSTW